MRTASRVAFALALCACIARAAAQQFPPVVPGMRLEFPRDHGAHPAFRTEWWYLTGHLRDADGRALGFQVTFFRSRTGIGEDTASRFAPAQLIFAHAALADAGAGKLRHDQRAARAGFGLAEARTGSAGIVLGDWTLVQTEHGFRAAVAAREFDLQLDFAAPLAPLLQGDSASPGFSRKGPGTRNASYYYSVPQLRASGTVSIRAENARAGAAHVTGVAWLDHEWSSELMPATAQGWDWTGINFTEGSRKGGALMAFRMRATDGSTLWSAGTLLEPDGAVARLSGDQVAFVPEQRWRSPRSGIEYPVAMAVRANNVTWRLSPLLPDQELDARAGTGAVYWEGAVTASRDGSPEGVGYLELTGYGRPLRF